MREGLTRELYVNGVEDEKDIINDSDNSEVTEDSIDKVD